jgi:hypothetical protein
MQGAWLLLLQDVPRLSNLRRRVLDATALCTQAGTILRGRQTFWFIQRHYQTDHCKQYGLNDLSQIVINIDPEKRADATTDDLEDFLGIWESVLNKIKERPSNEYLMSHFFPKIEDVAMLKEDIVQFNKATKRPKRDKEGYDHFVKIIQWYIDEKRDDINLKARHPSQQGGHDLENRRRRRERINDEEKVRKEKQRRNNNNNNRDAAPAEVKNQGGREEPRGALALEDKNPPEFDPRTHTKNGRPKSSMDCNNMKRYGNCRKREVGCPYRHEGVEKRGPSNVSNEPRRPEVAQPRTNGRDTGSETDTSSYRDGDSQAGRSSGGESHYTAGDSQDSHSTLENSEDRYRKRNLSDTEPIGTEPPAAAPAVYEPPKGKGKGKGKKGKGKDKGKIPWLEVAHPPTMRNAEGWPCEPDGTVWTEERPCWSYLHCKKPWCAFIHGPDPLENGAAGGVALPGAAIAAPAVPKDQDQRRGNSPAANNQKSGATRGRAIAQKK